MATTSGYNTAGAYPTFPSPATTAPVISQTTTMSGFGKMPHSTVPFKSSFPRLYNNFLQFAWAIMFYAGSISIFFMELPWRVALWMSPHGFIKNTINNLAYTVYEWTMPLRNLVESTVYSVLEFADTTMSRGVRGAMHAHRGNLTHFKVALEAYLRLIQEKTEIIERHGLRGIPIALSPTKVAKAA